MITEKWKCNRCGGDCRVEIDFDETGPTGKSQRFRGRCIAGEIDRPECFYPQWVRQNQENLADSPASPVQQTHSAIALLREWVATEFFSESFTDEKYGSLLRRTDAVLAQQRHARNVVKNFSRAFYK